VGPDTSEKTEPPLGTGTGTPSHRLPEPAGAHGPEAPGADRAAAGPTESTSEALEAQGTLPDGQKDARAREPLDLDRLPQEIERLKRLVHTQPENLAALLALGMMHGRSGEYDAAMECFELALERHPADVQVLTRCAVALTELARYEEASDRLREALRLAPDDPGARLALGVLSFRRGLYSQAEGELTWVCLRQPDNGRAFYYRGEALNRAGRYEEAAEVMAEAARLLPDDPRPHYTLGHLYDRRGLREEASVMYRRARDLQARLDAESS
jgi:Flp pilus assembly protein TadD